MKIIKRSFKLV